MNLLDINFDLDLFLDTRMRFSSRLAVTLRLVRSSLFPGVTPGSLPPSYYRADLSRVVSPEELYPSLRNTLHPADTTGKFSFFVTGAFFLAAPLVLFRLKRWGFSGCRVLVAQDGLQIEARR